MLSGERLSVIRILLAGLCALAASQPGNAQEWLIDGSFKIQPEYDDNLRLLPGVKDGTFGLTGGLDIKAKKDTGATQIDLRGVAEGTAYSNTDIPNDGLALVDLGYRHGLSERSEIGLDGSFLSDSSLENQLDDPADIDQGLSSYNIRRNKLDLAPSWTYALTERSGLDLAYEFIGVAYGDNKERADLENYLYNSAVGRLFYRWTERTTVSGIPQVFGYTSSDSENHFTGGSLSIGLEHRFSETLSAALAFGGYNTDFDIDDQTSSASGGLFSASLIKRGERTRVRGLVSRTLRPSGSGQMREADQVLLGVKRSITPQVDFSFRARYLKTRNIGVGNSNERQYVLVEPGITWHLNERLDLAATYRYRSKEDQGIGETTAESNQGVVSLIYNWPSAPDVR